MRIFVVMLMMVSLGHQAFCGWWPFSSSEEEKVVDVQRLQDPLAHVNHRHWEYFVELSDSHSGLLSDAEMDALLAHQDYIGVLNCLWTEENQVARIQWLEKKRGEYHPLLLAELALEYMERENSIQNYLYHARPLLDVAVSLTKIDSLCSSDEGVAGAAAFLQAHYGDHLKTALLKRYSIESLQRRWKKKIVEIEKNRFALLREALSRFTIPQPAHPVPSPEWVFAHGNEGFVDQVNAAAFPKEQWSEIRKAAADAQLQEIRKDESRLFVDPVSYMRQSLKTF